MAKLSNFSLFIILLILIFGLDVLDSKLMKVRMRGAKKLSSRVVQLNATRKTVEQFKQPKGARIIKYSHFDYDLILGHKIKFICVAQGIPVPSIDWLKDGIELYSHPYANIYEWLLPNNQIKSKLEIDPARQMDEGTYECQANNKYTVDRKQFKADF